MYRKNPQYYYSTDATTHNYHATSSGTDVNNEIYDYNSIDTIRKVSTARQSSSFGVCKVCGDCSTGIHYGVVSCEGCKGFYKRTLARKDKYRCYFGMSCPITAETRNRCKACRFEKCRQVGMSVESGVKTGRVAESEEKTVVAASTQNIEPHTAKISPKKTTITANEFIFQACIKYYMQLKYEKSCSTTATEASTNIVSNYRSSSNQQQSKPTCNNHANNEQEKQNATTRPPSPVTTLIKALNNHEQTIHLFKNKMHAVYIHHSNRILTSLHHAHASIAVNRLFDGDMCSLKDLWVGMLQTINVEVKSLTSFLKDIPGLGDLYTSIDFVSIVNNRLFDYYIMMSSSLFINGESFYTLPNGVQYSKKWMVALIGNENTEGRFEFAEKYNELGLSNKEKALLFPLVFTVYDPKLSQPERLQSLHEYYMKALVQEMMENKRDSTFVAKLKQLLELLPRLNELESKNARMLTPMVD